MDLENKEVTIKLPSIDNVLYFYGDIETLSIKDFVKDYIEKCRIIKSNTEYAQRQVNDVIKAFNLYNENEIELHMPYMNIVLSTYGGSIYDGLGMYNTIKAYSKSVPTRIYASGMCMSMGIPLLCSVPYDNRFAFKNTTFMIHQLSACSLGTLKDITERQNELEKLHKTMFDIIVQNTEIPQYKLDEVYEKKIDWILSAEEALNYGLISSIVDTPKF